MSKNHIWIGTFSTEIEFEKYIDQSAYYQAWDKYNNEPLKDGEEDIEPSDELRCNFCKEIGMDSYDEDLLYIYFEASGNFNVLMSRLPADLIKVLPACNENGIKSGNAFICYPTKEVQNNVHPEKTKGMVYIGEFSETNPTPLVEDENSRLGLEDCVWAGLISEPKETFMKYFEQGEYLSLLANKKKPKENFSCEFCRDINVPYYLPEHIQIFYTDKPDCAQVIIEKAISSSKLTESILSDIKQRFSEEQKFNAVVHLVQHETKKEKEEPKVRIYPKELLESYPIPKKFVAEKDSYNGLTYIGKFGWD